MLAQDLPHNPRTLAELLLSNLDRRPKEIASHESEARLLVLFFFAFYTRTVIHVWDADRLQDQSDPQSFGSRYARSDAGSITKKRCSLSKTEFETLDTVSAEFSSGC